MIGGQACRDPLSFEQIDVGVDFYGLGGCVPRCLPGVHREPLADLTDVVSDVVSVNAGLRLLKGS
jgi:hypothetical protein